MRGARSLSLTLGALLPAFALACGSEPPDSAPAWAPKAAPGGDHAVAEVGGVPIFASDVVAQARRTSGTADSALEDLIRFELLATAAREAGHQDDPDVREALKSALVERMIEREYETRLAPEQIPDAYLRPLYERNIARFVHPRLVRIGILVVYTGPTMKPEPRARREAIARQLFARVAALPPGPATALQELAQAPAFNSLVVYMDTWQGGAKPFGAAVDRGVSALTKAGDTTRPMDDEYGLYVARYIDERAPQNVSFEDARAAMRPLAFEKWRLDAFLEMATTAASTHTTQVFPDALKTMARDRTATKTD